jgi:hypothetical protein
MKFKLWYINKLLFAAALCLWITYLFATTISPLYEAYKYKHVINGTVGLAIGIIIGYFFFLKRKSI